MWRASRLLATRLPKQGIERLAETFGSFADVAVSDRGLIWNTDLVETLELHNLLLSGWLEREFERAGAAGRRQFEALLALPDPQLAGYLLGLERPEGVELASLV